MIGVIGAGSCDDRIYHIAEQVGFELASRGYTLVCGGLGGVMEAACKGAKKGNGTTVGILPGTKVSEANSFVDIAVATGLGIARNIIIVRSTQALLAINGGFGTLSEIAFALQLDRPVIGIETWDVSEKITHVSSVEAAIDELEKVLGK
jgi:uncharacterized protein (TIGR00725 family)